MKALKIIAAVIVALIAVYLILALLGSPAFNVQRKIVINAPPQSVFKAVNSFKLWDNWSPWLKQDSTIKNTYSGPESGVGSKMEWTSRKSGSGSMEIIESEPAKLITTRVSIENFTPFEAHFIFNNSGSGTEVSWADSGSTNFLWRPMNFMFVKMMGKDFEEGLNNLRAYVESMPQWHLSEFKIEEVPGQTILGVKDSCPAIAVGNKLGNLYGEIGAVISKNQLQFAGPVMAYYYAYSPDKVVLEAAVPVSKKVKDEGRVRERTTEKAKALTVSYFGDYSYMKDAMKDIRAYMAKNNLEQNGPECEVYITDPGTVTDKNTIETRMVFPVK